MMKIAFGRWGCGMVLAAVAVLPCAAAVPALIPQPCEMVAGGEILTLPTACPVRSETPEDARRLGLVLRAAGITMTPSTATGAIVRLQRGPVKNPHGFPGAYHLRVTDTELSVTAADAPGFIHAAETLRQLLQTKAGATTLPAVEISDWPALPLRGFMLDTGRNFQSLPLLKEQLDVMARYKLNVFHFHFTDNPGWRLESQVHPAVTAAASMTRTPGKFHTQQDLRELIAYCRERGITLIPEMDMPGHSEAFRKALGIKSMNDPASRQILKDLLTELAALATPEEMPFIHLGTDEVHGAAEKVDATFLPEMSAHVRSLGRQVIGWHKGLEDKTDATRITQLWARASPLPKNPYLDSRSTYLNHMDPHECVSTFLFQQSCRQPHGDARALGGVMCSWPDVRIEDERDQLRQNPIYPGMLAFAESLWRGVEQDDHEKYWANLPAVGTPEFARFREFETRLLEHKARFFHDQPFPYVKQTDLRWRIIGPFPNDNDVARAFPVETGLRDSYEVAGKTYRWQDREIGAATLYFNHFFGFGGLVKETQGTCYALTHIWSPAAKSIPVWIGFHHTSRSDRRGGVERAVPGQWHASQPWVRVNGALIPPPQWQSTAPKTNETPFTDEDYFMRPPATITLRVGWNEILLKVPKAAGGWKWVATFVPCGDASGLRYSSALPK